MFFGLNDNVLGNFTDLILDQLYQQITTTGPPAFMLSNSAKALLIDRVRKLPIEPIIEQPDLVTKFLTNPTAHRKNLLFSGIEFCGCIQTLEHLDVL